MQAPASFASETGVARRRRMPLKGIRVEITANPFFSRKGEAEEAAAEGRAVQSKPALKRIIVKGDLSERDPQILKNTAKHCPVSRLFEYGLLEFRDECAIER